MRRLVRDSAKKGSKFALDMPEDGSFGVVQEMPFLFVGPYA